MVTGSDRPGLPIRVLIVDDHPLIVEGLQLLLEKEPDIQVVGTASTGADALELARHVRPTLVLMDFHLPDCSGSSVAAQMRDDVPESAVVFLSADDSDEAVAEAIQAGAAGYLPKGDMPSVITDSIRHAAAGKMLIPARVIARVFTSQRSKARTQIEHSKLVEQFTPRERDVLGLMGEGLDNAAIAARLLIELTTVRWHVRNILEKLGAHSKLEAVARAADLGLLDR
jgi:DNA-binding NarL/FixJ family response regulator